MELATKLARKRAQPGDGDAALTSLAQLGAEIEVAFYLEAIWPGEQPSRQVRWAEASLPATLRGTCAQPATLTIQPATSRMQPAAPCAQPTCLPMQPATRCAQVRRGEADQPAGTEGAGEAVAAWRLGRAMASLQALLTMALLTMALLTMALLTMALLTMALLTMALLTMALLTMALLSKLSACSIPPSTTHAPPSTTPRRCPLFTPQACRVEASHACARNHEAGA